MRRISPFALLLLTLGAPAVAAAQDIRPRPPAEIIAPQTTPPAGSDAGAPPAAAESPAEDPLGVASNVSAVRIAGSWDTADGKGFSRLVGVIDGDRQRFFVQWLAEPDGGVVDTRELEDDEAAARRFGDIRVETGQTGSTVFMDTLPDGDGIRETWVLIVGPPGEIRFGPATN